MVNTVQALPQDVHQVRVCVCVCVCVCSDVSRRVLATVMCVLCVCMLCVYVVCVCISCMPV